MTTQAWLTLYLCAMIIGGMIGWAARTHTTGDRYIQGMADQYIASARYYNERTDQLIRENGPKLKGTMK